MKTLIKTNLSVLAITLLAVTSRAEGVGIAETEITPDPSAMLEVASTNKGALFPRMTTAQRLAIATPAVGLLVYDTDVDGFFYRTPADWELIGTSSSGSPAGSVTAFAGTTNSMPNGWLLCDGTAVNSSNYPSLYAAIGTAWGDATDDTDSETDFRIPDMRGYFLRGVLHGGTSDPDVASRTGTAGGNMGNNVGSYQSDGFQGHEHSATPKDGLGGVGFFAYGNGFTNPDVATQNIVSDGVNGSPRFSSETRPKNVYVNYIIKY